MNAARSPSRSESPIYKSHSARSIVGVDRSVTCTALERLVGDSVQGSAGIAELREIDLLLTAAGYGPAAIRFDPSIVRGLAYYTGPVVETDVTFPVKGSNDQPLHLGAVASGGRYDDLITRFKGIQIPSTGVSIGVSRLQLALKEKGSALADEVRPVVVLVLDREATPSYMNMVRELRAAGIRAEVYAGTSWMKAQLKYADKRDAPVAVIEGGDERAKGLVTLKDLKLGAERAKDIKDRDAWAKGADAQVTVPRADLVTEVKKIIAAQKARA